MNVRAALSKKSLNECMVICKNCKESFFANKLLMMMIFPLDLKKVLSSEMDQAESRVFEKSACPLLSKSPLKVLSSEIDPAEIRLSR